MPVKLGGGGGVKSIQRGVYTGGGGTITISSVDTSKSVISTISKSSAGTVAATGNITGTLSPSGGTPVKPAWNGYEISQYVQMYQASYASYTGTRALSSGTTSLTTKQYSAVITNATTITADGPCEWQVVEYS